MRPTAEKQDPLRAPLNDIFGSEGNVRILRVLAFADAPIGRASVARRARLDPSGVRRSLEDLAALGIVEAIGSGRNQSVRLRSRHPLSDPIRHLFEAERRGFDEFVSAAKSALRSNGSPARAVWIESPEARTPGTVHLGVLAPADDVDDVRDAVESQLRDVEQELATHFVVHAYTDADLVALSDEETDRLRDLTLLDGWLPKHWRESSGGPVRSHRHLDERARRLAAAIADVLPNDPSLIERARRWIDDRLEEASRGEARDLKEWRRILQDLSIQQIQSFLREDSERADRLRQSLPFVDALQPEQRNLVLERSEP